MNGIIYYSAYFQLLIQSFCFQTATKKPQKKAGIGFFCGFFRAAQLISFCVMQSEVRLNAASVWSNSPTWFSIR